MPITSLELRNIGPITDTSFEFDPGVNVLVGPNNSGKTTVLLALANILIPDVALPEKLVRSGAAFTADISGRRSGGTLPLPSRVKETAPYCDDLVKLGYRVFIPAIRLATDFRSEGPGDSPLVRSSALWSEDKRVIQKMVDLDYKSYRESRPAIRALLDLIADLASGITEGFSLAFAGIDEDEKGLFPRFKTPDGIVPMDVLSQGTQSLLQWCAQFVIGFAEYYDFPESLADKQGVLLVDEIDAHLHPSWQRRILPTLTKRFSRLQIICAAHSPMTLAGLCAGQIHLLRRTPTGGIWVTRNTVDILGWSADEIYSAFMDVDPTDLVTLNRLKRAQELRAITHPTESESRELDTLREEIRQGLSGGSVRKESEILAAELKRAAEAAAKSALGHNGQATRKTPAPKTPKAVGKRRRR